MMSFAMKNCASVSILALSLALGGCATKLNLEAPYDDMTFEKALPESTRQNRLRSSRCQKYCRYPGNSSRGPSKA
jgi:type IV secretion system protein TrbG